LTENLLKKVDILSKRKVRGSERNTIKYSEGVEGLAAVALGAFVGFTWLEAEFRIVDPLDEASLGKSEKTISFA
jgi:hypothetical protein